MKSYTNLEQSQKLAEILPIESADMWWNWFSDPFDEVNGGEYTTEPLLHKPVCYPEKVIPCWSLAALLGVVSEVSLNSFKGGNWNAMVQQNGKIIYSDAGNPIDACYEMILKLHEEKII